MKVVKEVKKSLDYTQLTRGHVYCPVTHPELFYLCSLDGLHGKMCLVCLNTAAIYTAESFKDEGFVEVEVELHVL